VFGQTSTGHSMLSSEASGYPAQGAERIHRSVGRQIH
jgi:hypothetical protein